MSRKILNGWKEISNYLGRSVRTVQRWEAGLGLPVFRPALKERSAVVAFSDELDRWISRASPGVGEESGVPNGNERNDGLVWLFNNGNGPLLDAAELSFRIGLLQEELRRLLEGSQHQILSRALAPTASTPSRVMGPVLTFRTPPRNVPVDQMIFGTNVSALVDPSEGTPGHSPAAKTR